MVDRQLWKLLNQRLPLAGLAIIWLGFALRLHNLGGDSFWIDEILTVRSAGGGVEAILSIRDHPPLLYALTSFSRQLFGDGEFGSRIAPFLAGVLALPLLILFGRLMHRPAAGLWAALLLSLSSFHVGWSQTARQYALLTTITLATYVVLYLALQRPRWSTWLVYAGLTLMGLYTHYGSLIVLAAQILLIAAWLLAKFLKGERRSSILYFPAAAGAVVILLFLPWLPRFQLALKANMGRGIATGTGTITPLTEWARSAFWAFNLESAFLPYALLALFLTGIIVLAWQRKWTELGLLIAATFLSLAMVSLFQVARGPFARYISFIQPFYLLSSGIALAVILEVTAGKLSVKYGQTIISAGLALLMLAIAWPGLQREYDFVLEDWQSILAFLDQEAHEGDVLVGLSLNYRNGFNLVEASSPYYLREQNREYVYLSGNALQDEELTAFIGSEKDVWAIIFDWEIPTRLDQSALDIVPFQTALFVARDSEQQGPTLARIRDLYGQLIPLVNELPQRCLMHRDRAALSVADGDWLAIADELAFIEAACPEIADDSLVRSLTKALLPGKLSHLVQTGQADEMLSTAKELLAFDRKNELALEVLTAVDLGQLFTDGAAIVRNEESPEPVRLMKFTMPHNGDWEEALLIHPPAAVSYMLTLPEEPVSFNALLAQAPESWSWGGDGVTYVLQVQPAGEEPLELFRRHIGNSAGDHDWHNVEISLADYAGQQVTLTLTTESGPAGDSTGDWSGWVAPRLMWISPDDQE